ncbi:hypothetical protein MRX96_016046 [Rhipicephalus microplus]
MQTNCGRVPRRTEKTPQPGAPKHPPPLLTKPRLRQLAWLTPRRWSRRRSLFDRSAPPVQQATVASSKVTLVKA